MEWKKFNIKTTGLMKSIGFKKRMKWYSVKKKNFSLHSIFISINLFQIYNIFWQNWFNFMQPCTWLLPKTANRFQQTSYILYFIILVLHILLDRGFLMIVMNSQENLSHIYVTEQLICKIRVSLCWTINQAELTCF